MKIADDCGYEMPHERLRADMDLTAPLVEAFNGFKLRKILFVMSWFMRDVASGAGFTHHARVCCTHKMCYSNSIMLSHARALTKKFINE